MADKCSDCGKFFSWNDADARNESYEYYSYWYESIEEEELFVCGKCSRGEKKKLK